MKFYALTSVYKMSHLDGGCELRAPVPYSLPQGKSRFQPQGKSRLSTSSSKDVFANWSVGSPITFTRQVLEYHFDLLSKFYW